MSAVLVMQTFSSTVSILLLTLSAASFSGCNQASQSGSAEDPTAHESTASSEALTIVVGGSGDARETAFTAHPTIPNSIVIGLDADMSSAASQSGEAIRRGVVLAIEEINAGGGLLGRQLELVVRDHRGNPDRGIDNIDEFAGMRDVIAVVGGLHTPVALRELDAIHEAKLIYLGPWAAGTPIVENGFSPNFVFRVSVRDEYAGGFLVDRALSRGMRRIGFLLERTAWGRSNERAMLAALEARGIQPAGIEWVNLGEYELAGQLNRLIDRAQADSVILVSNPLEGAAVVGAMASRAEADRVPIISHWGITGANFVELARGDLSSVDLSFLQTHSFLEPRFENRSRAFVDAYAARFEDCETPQEIFSPVGTAHAYDVIHLLALAVERAGTVEREKVRDALEGDLMFDGLVKKYRAPFSPEHHDALSAEEFILAEFASDGTIHPIGQ